MSAPICSMRGCGNSTRDPSGRCHHHRGDRGAKVYLPPPMPMGGNVIRSITAVHPNGRMKTVEYTRNGRLDRSDGPAQVTYFENGDRKSEIYYRYGKVHRDGDEPAWIDYYRYGGVEKESYFRSDVLVREGHPSALRYDEGGHLVEEHFDDAELARRGPEHPSRISYSGISGEVTDRWYRAVGENGGRFDGGPTLVSYFQGEVVQSEQWRNPQGDLHRVDGPALVTYREDGRVASEEWFDDGSRHRSGAPAVLRRRRKSDAIGVEEWWVDGRKHRFGGPCEVTYNELGTQTSLTHSIYGAEGLSAESSLLTISRDRTKIERLIETSEYAPLVAEGASSEAIFYAVREGITTVEGVREVVVSGAPVEWVRAFLEGSSKSPVEQ